MRISDWSSDVCSSDLKTQGLNPEKNLVIMGSSLGGYYATCLAEHWKCRAIVLNPVVYAARDLATQVGEHTMYHSNDPFVFLPEYVDELRSEEHTSELQSLMRTSYAVFC